jgi:hypothetical protein
LDVVGFVVCWVLRVGFDVVGLDGPNGNDEGPSHAPPAHGWSSHVFKQMINGEDLWSAYSARWQRTMWNRVNKENYVIVTIQE